MRKVLDVFKEPLALLEKASHCEKCDWEFSQRLREKGIGFLLPEVQPLRNGITLLCFKARIELAEDRPDKALQTMQVGYQMVYGTCPGALETANDLDAGSINDKQIQHVTRMLFGISDQQSNFATRLLMANQISMKHETAKRVLVAAGRPRAKVDSWPHLQVAL